MPTTERTSARAVDDWRAFLDSGLDPDDHAALLATERTGRLR